ncbi:MAG: peptidase M48 Ste24p, partial [Erythrobacter sp.]
MAKSITRLTLAIGAAALALAGGAGMGGVAATAQIPASSAPITPQEAQMGAQYHPQFLAEFGGAMSGPQAAYVEQVGKNIAVQSGL